MQKLLKIVFCIIFVIILTVFGINIFWKHYSKTHISTSIESSLIKVLNINELHSLEYKYDSWATVYETKYNMKQYEQYKNIVSIFENDKKQIQDDYDEPNFENNFKKYKEKLKEQYGKYQNLVSNNASFEELANSGFKDSKLFSIAKKETKSKDPNEIYNYYYYTLLPKRFEIFSICDSYDDLCSLEQFLNLKESKAKESTRKIKYVVAYKGTVRLGIDAPIKFEKDENGPLLICIPSIKVLSVAVDFLPPEIDEKGGKKVTTKSSVIEFSKKDDNFSKEARLKCNNDLYAKINMNQQYFKLAEENLKKTVEALIKPVIGDLTYEFKTLPSEEQEEE